MRRIGIILATTASGIALAANVAVAAHGPVMPWQNSSVSEKTGALTVDFALGYLGVNPPANVHVEVNVHSAVAVYQCFDHNVGTERTKTVSAQLSTAGNVDTGYRAGPNPGGTLTVAAPGPGDFDCAVGQKLYLESVTYSGIFFSTPQSAKTVKPDPISTGPVHIAVR
jgi:hypothetical protein